MENKEGQCVICGHSLAPDDADLCDTCESLLYDEKDAENERCYRCLDVFCVLATRQCRRCGATFPLCPWCPFYGICPPFFGCHSILSDP